MTATAMSPGDPTLKFLIYHPLSLDRAYGEDRGEAESAARTLRREATEHGFSPRAKCVIVHLPAEEDDNEA